MPRTPRTTLPRITPILPLLSREVPVGPEWVYEAKLDGFRGVLAIENGLGSFTSKTSKPMPRFQHLADRIAREMKVRSAIFDGEIVVMSDRGPDFDALFYSRGEPAYAAFDLLWLNGEDLRPWPWKRRKARLQKLTARGPIGFVEAVTDPALFEVTTRMDLEGIVAKRVLDPYDPATLWVKVKHRGYSQMEGRAEKFYRRR